MTVLVRTSSNLTDQPTDREIHVALKISYVYDYITKLSRTQGEVILNYINPNVHGVGQG
jgi:hypothetical protein